MSTDFSILSSCTSGGCGAKIEPEALSLLLKEIPKYESENLTVGYDSSDDAAVYRIDDVQSIVSTVDFFSPMVDDAKTFGKIAAANALSDVYAMGAKPIIALNLVCFPEKMPKEILSEILLGGAEKAIEAGVVLAGGHSIYDSEPKYGLSVTGIVDNDKIIRNNTTKLGDTLILTKPLGTGIVMAAKRIGLADDLAYEKSIANMVLLNKYAAEHMRGYHVSACTDITGFGLMGHLLEMIGDNSIELYIDGLPVISEAVDYADEYILTAAGQRNRNFFMNKNITSNVEDLPFGLQEVVFDPQTSGGLLICVDSSEAEELVEAIKEHNPDASIIGKIVEPSAEQISFK